MARSKVDGIIEAVRYASNGKVELVRFYERHGAAWSDRLLIGRRELVEKLQAGKRFATGQRKTYLGSVFEIGSTVRYKGGQILSNGQAADRDSLADIPIF